MMTNEDKQEFAYFLRSMRESVEYSVSEMAEKLDVGNKSLIKWENGHMQSEIDTYMIEYRIRQIVKDHWKQVRNAS